MTPGCHRGRTGCLLPLHHGLCGNNNCCLHQRSFTATCHFFRTCVSYTSRPLFDTRAFPVDSLSPTTFCTIFTTCGLSRPTLILHCTPLTVTSDAGRVCLLRCLTRACTLSSSAIDCHRALQRKFAGCPSGDCFFGRLTECCDHRSRRSDLCRLSRRVLTVSDLRVPTLVAVDSVLFLHRECSAYVTLYSGVVALSTSRRIPCVGTKLSCCGRAVTLSRGAHGATARRRRLRRLCLRTVRCLSVTHRLSPRTVSL